MTGPDQTTVMDIDDGSKGAIWYLSFLLKTEFRKKHLRSQSGQTIYLIDEPASNLHSTAQVNMIGDFRELASDSNVIYTTHSQHLIDKENLANVYIAKSVGGNVNVVKYSDFVKNKKIKTSHYQPIIDALEIQPFNLDIPWNRVLIVEGVYDYIGFKLFSEILGKKLDYVIMPGTGATKLATLISLHIGWTASICVLLDCDEEGVAAQKKYTKQFPTIKPRILTYKHFRPGVVKTCFEGLITDDDQKTIVNIANDSNYSANITKKQIQQALATTLYHQSKKKKVKSNLSEETKNNFAVILDQIAKILAS